MHWIFLIIAGLFEVAFASCLTKSQNSTGAPFYWWFAGFIICLSASMYLLIQATKQIPMGTAYAVWTGIGAVGSVLVGILIFKEPTNFWRLFFVTTLILSVVGLKFVSE